MCRGPNEIATSPRGQDVTSEGPRQARRRRLRVNCLLSHWHTTIIRSHTSDTRVHTPPCTVTSRSATIKRVSSSPLLDSPPVFTTFFSPPVTNDPYYAATFVVIVDDYHPVISVTSYLALLRTFNFESFSKGFSLFSILELTLRDEVK